MAASRSCGSGERDAALDAALVAAAPAGTAPLVSAAAPPPAPPRQRQRTHLAALALHQHISHALRPGAGVCCDVSITAFGRVYRLHKLILVQATFFHSLLTGAFSEASVSLTPLHFPDPNMSRPALEYCLATLYGAAPALQLPAWANPRADAPLGAAFPHPPPPAHAPPQAQIATPRFLLSLIATSNYLGLPSVTSLALTLICASITPYTAVTYLRFATGLGIVPPSSAMRVGSPPVDELLQPLVGWSALSSPLAFGSPTATTAPASTSGTTQPSPSPSPPPGPPPSSQQSSWPLLFHGPSCSKIGQAAVCWLCRWGSDVLDWEMQLTPGRAETATPMPGTTPVLPSPSHSPLQAPVELPHLESQDTPLLSPRIPSPVSLEVADGSSDGVGESNSSGIRRSRTDSSSGSISESAEGALRALRGRQTPTISPLEEPAEPEVQAEGTLEPPPPVPVVWKYHPELGLPSSAVRHVISSDSFFTLTEWARYKFARQVVEFRRLKKEQWMSQPPTPWGGESPDARDEGSGRSKTVGEKREHRAPLLSRDEDEDEKEYRELFTTGIYYTHMSFDELSSMADDLSPSSSELYTSRDVLQRGLWSGMELRTRIESCAPDKAVEGLEEFSDLDLALTLDSFGPDEEDDLLPPLSPPSRSRPPASPGSLSRRARASKRFFPVPEDETVKLGDNLGSLLSTSQAIREQLSQSKVDLEEVVADPGFSGATGLAALRDLHALPLPASKREMASAATSFGILDRSLRGHELEALYLRDAATVPRSQRDAAAIPRSLGEMWVPFEPMRIGVDFWGVDKLQERNRLYSPTWFYAGSLWNLYVVTVRKTKGVQLGIYLHRQNPSENLPPASAPPDEGEKPRVSAPSLDKLLSESLNLDPVEDGPTLVPCARPAMPYTDSRKAIRAFFSIHCPSPLGNALTRFSSGPDHFTLSQSWGWKSSSLLGTLSLSDGRLEDAKPDWATRFRCVCTLGLV